MLSIEGTVLTESLITETSGVIAKQELGEALLNESGHRSCGGSPRECPVPFCQNNNKCFQQIWGK